MHIANDGKVGIGGASAGAMLEVPGQIHITSGDLKFPDGSVMSVAGVGSANNLAASGDAIITGDSDDNGGEDVVIKTGTAERMRIHDTGEIDMQSASPSLSWNETDQAADNKKWDFSAADHFSGRAVSDNGTTQTPWVRVERTGTTIDNVVFPNGQVGIGTGTATLNMALDVAAVSGNGSPLRLQTSDFVQGSTGTSLDFEFGATSGNTYAVIQPRIAGATDNGNLILIPNNGKVGIKTTSPDHLLELGTGSYSEINAAEAQFTTSSHSSFKENFASVDYAAVVAAFSNLSVQRYNFRAAFLQEAHAAHFARIDADAKATAAQRQTARTRLNAEIQEQSAKPFVGLMADDFYPIAQALNPEEADPEKLSGDMVQSALVIMVQELQKKNAELEARIAALEGP